jgi:hypothetical protein
MAPAEREGHETILHFTENQYLTKTLKSLLTELLTKILWAAIMYKFSMKKR